MKHIYVKGDLVLNSLVLEKLNIYLGKENVLKAVNQQDTSDPSIRARLRKRYERITKDENKKNYWEDE